MSLDWFQLSLVELVLLASLLAVFLIQLFYYLYYYSCPYFQDVFLPLL